MLFNENWSSVNNRVFSHLLWRDCRWQLYSNSVFICSHFILWSFYVYCLHLSIKFSYFYRKQREAEEAEKRIREAIMKRQEEEKKRLKEEKERKEKADAVRRISEEASIKLENEKVTELISEIAREIWR